MNKYGHIFDLLNIKKWISSITSRGNKATKYFIACFYLKKDIIDNLSYLKLETELIKILKGLNIPLKQEAFSYHENSDVKKIRRINMKEKPISKILEKSEPFEEIGIYISDEHWKWINEPDLLVNLHLSKESLVKNEKLYGFLIIGINKKLDFDLKDTLAKIKSIYNDIDGIGGGNFNNQEYIFKRTKSTNKDYHFFDDTSIKYAFINFTNNVESKGISNWTPGFDNKW